MDDGVDNETSRRECRRRGTEEMSGTVAEAVYDVVIVGGGLPAR
jgi:hypothetical protein